MGECCKRQFLTKRAAKRALKVAGRAPAKQPRTHNHSTRPVAVYKCQICGWWHLTSRVWTQEPPRQERAA